MQNDTTGQGNEDPLKHLPAFADCPDNPLMLPVTAMDWQKKRKKKRKDKHRHRHRHKLEATNVRASMRCETTSPLVPHKWSARKEKDGHSHDFDEQHRNQVRRLRMRSCLLCLRSNLLCCACSLRMILLGPGRLVLRR